MAAGAGHLAGFFHAQICFRDSNGYPMGADSTPDAVSALDVKHAYKLTGPVAATAPSPTREVATFRGGQNVLGQMAMGTSAFGTFDLTLSAYDEVFNAYITGSVNDVTNVGTANVLSADNELLANLPQFFLVLSGKFQDSTGTNKYMHYIYNNVTFQAAPIGLTQEAGVNPGAVTYTVVPSTSTRTIFGYLFSATSLALQDNKGVVMKWRTDNPVSFTTYIDDASATSFVVGYRPTNSENAGAVNVFTKNGVINHTGVAAFSTTTGATTHTAGSSLDKWVVSYETNYVSI
jgi:hypothetical protein